MNAENTGLVYKLFERVVSEINSKPDLMNITREEDDMIDPNIDSDAADQRAKGLFSRLLCCSERAKPKSNAKHDKKDNKKNSEIYEDEDTNQGVEDEYLNAINEEENKTNKKMVIQKNGKLSPLDTNSNPLVKPPASVSEPQSDDRGESDDNKDKRDDPKNKENGCLVF